MGTVVNLRDYTSRKRAELSERYSEAYDELCVLAVDIMQARKLMDEISSGVFQMAYAVKAMNDKFQSDGREG